MILIDGQNLWHALYGMDDREYLTSLEEMIGRIHAISESKKKKCILVMDGTGGGSVHGRKARKGSYLEIVYSGGDMSADDWIAGWTEREKGENVLLVSNDVKLYQRIQRKKVTRKACTAWMGEMERKQITPQKANFGDTEYWLKEFGASEKEE